eukprot:s540_g4.t1
MATWKHQHQQQSGEQPWYCSNCRIMRKASAGHCDRCGQSWTEAADPNFVYQGQRPSSRQTGGYRESDQDTWSARQWVKQPRRPSRRRNQDAPTAQQRQPSRRAAKGNAKGQGKGASSKQDHARTITMPAPQQDPPWNMAAPPMPMMPAPPPAPTVSNALDPQTAELIAMISKNPDGRPPEVQAAFHALQAKNAQKESKILHSAVSNLTKAKQELADAQLHRSNLHSAWIKFLQDSIAKWQDCRGQFQEQEETAVSRIRAAQALYTSACDTLNRTKKEAGVANTEEVVDVEEMELTGVSTVNSTKISDSLASLQTSLNELHQSAEELAAQETHTAKRPRLDQADAEVAMGGSPTVPTTPSPVHPSKAMQPFPQPGQ